MSSYNDYMQAAQRIKDASPAVDNDYKQIGDAAATLCDINQTLVYNPNMTVVRNRGGDVIGYDYKYTSPIPPNGVAIDINSNNDTGTYGGVTGGGGTTSGGGAGRNRSSTYAGGVVTDPQTTDKMRGTGFVAGVISAAWAGAAVLGKLGKNVASATADALDTLGVNFGVNFGPLAVEVNGASALRALFGIDQNNNTSMYLDEDSIGALAIQARDEQFFAGGVPHYDPTIMPELVQAIPAIASIPFRPSSYVQYTYSDGRIMKYTMYNTSCKSYFITFTNSLTPPFSGYFDILSVSDTPGEWVIAEIIQGSDRRVEVQSYHRTYTYNGRRVYFNRLGSSWSAAVGPYDTSDCIDCAPYTTYDTYQNNVDRIAWMLCYTYEEEPAVPGVSDQSGATIPVDAITGADPHVVAQNLVSQYPTVMGSPVQIVVMDDSCNQKTINYYKVSIPYSPVGVNIGAPVTGTVQLNPDFNPNVELPDIDMSRYTNDITIQLDGSGAGDDVVTVDPTTGEPLTNPDTVPNTGSGNGSDPVLPETGVSSMWNVYNPSSSQLTSFGSWLWTGNIIEQIKRLLDNPMDAIIGVHAVYGAPSVGGTAPIVVGNLSSNVTANWVNKQYTTVDCGSVLLTEYFGNVLDYPPFTEISLFLPFIGIIPLDANDVMRAQISVKYNIDVFTGACIAMVSVIRDSVGGVLYQFAGNCAIAYPVSGQSYSSIFSSMISISLGVATAVATQGATAAHAAATVARGLVSAERQVQHSGAFAGNAGAMGPKKPYLIISRPQENLALNFELYDGYGSNEFTRIGDLTGYIKCKEVHLTVPGAYSDELAEIETLLRSGIIIS